MLGVQSTAGEMRWFLPFLSLHNNSQLKYNQRPGFYPEHQQPVFVLFSSNQNYNKILSASGRGFVKIARKPGMKTKVSSLFLLLRPSHDGKSVTSKRSGIDSIFCLFIVAL